MFLANPHHHTQKKQPPNGETRAAAEDSAPTYIHPVDSIAIVVVANMRRKVKVSLLFITHFVDGVVLCAQRYHVVVRVFPFLSQCSDTPSLVSNPPASDLPKLVGTVDGKKS